MFPKVGDLVRILRWRLPTSGTNKSMYEITSWTLRTTDHRIVEVDLNSLGLVLETTRYNNTNMSQTFVVLFDGTKKCLIDESFCEVVNERK